MSQRKRTMTNTAQGAHEMLATIQTTELKPTKALTEPELAAFNGIVRSRETASWSEYELMLATQLAEAMVLSDQYTNEIKRVGPTYIRPNGDISYNPLVSARDSMSRTVLQLTRVLALQAQAQGKGGTQQAKRNAADRAARGVLEKAAESDDLI